MIISPHKHQSRGDKWKWSQFFFPWSKTRHRETMILSNTLTKRNCNYYKSLKYFETRVVWNFKPCFKKKKKHHHYTYCKYCGEAVPVFDSWAQFSFSALRFSFQRSEQSMSGSSEIQPTPDKQRNVASINEPLTGDPGRSQLKQVRPHFVCWLTVKWWSSQASSFQRLPWQFNSCTSFFYSAHWPTSQQEMMWQQQKKSTNKSVFHIRCRLWVRC